MSKPPIFQTVKKAYKEVFQNIRALAWWAEPYLTLFVIVQTSALFWWAYDSGQKGVETIFSETALFFVALLWGLPLTVALILYGIKFYIGAYRVFIDGADSIVSSKRVAWSAMERSFAYRGILFTLASALFLAVFLFCWMTILGAAIEPYVLNVPWLLKTFGAVGGKILIAVMIALYAVIGGVIAMIPILRCRLYFPAKAVGTSISFLQSFRLFKGLAGRFIVTTCITVLPLYIMMTALHTLMMFMPIPVEGSLGGRMVFVGGYIVHMVEAVFIWGFISPLLMAGVFSEYYQWVRDNRLNQEAMA